MLPSLFISHGSPMLALEREPTSVFLGGLAGTLPKPKAILVISAHWETDEPELTGSQAPETIHDFRGFPPELYALRYNAPGSPELAQRISALLKEGSVDAKIDPARGLDHGVWNPLLLMYPQADIPVVELSVQPHKDAAWHYRIGQLLKPLRDENILIIGTGNLTHNLREAMRAHHDTTPAWVTEFANWVAERILKGDSASLLNWQNLAPHALKNHSTPEHFLPFFVALGAANTPLKANRLHDDVALGVLAMDAYAFE